MFKLTEMVACEQPCFDPTYSDGYQTVELPDARQDKSKKKVRFAGDSHAAVDVCACCKSEPCGKTGKPVLVYEIPEPEIDDLTISRRDYDLKPLPPRGLPPWHPTLSAGWRSLEVPSMKESTYRQDYRPPPLDAREREARIYYLMPKTEERIQHEECDPYPLYKVTSREPGVVHRICERALVVGERHEHDIQCQEVREIQECKPSQKRTAECDFCEGGDTKDSRVEERLYQGGGYGGQEPAERDPRVTCKDGHPPDMAERTWRYAWDPCEKQHDCGCKLNSRTDKLPEIKYERGGLI